MHHLPLALAGLLAVSPAAAAPDFSDVTAEVRQQCAEGKFSGLVLVVADDAELLRIACQPAGSPAVLDGTRFKFFSMSKMFTGTAIAALADRGLIDLDAPISRYLPDLPVAWKPVLVRHLLEHSSGIPDLTEQLLGEFTAGGARSHRAAMEHLLMALPNDQALASEPGKSWAYSNFGYELLAQIGANVGKRPFDQVLREIVFTPAGMNAVVIAEPRFLNGKLDGSVEVAGLIAGFNGKPGALEPSNSLSFVQLGAGAIIGTASDLVAYDRAMRANKLFSPRMAARSAAQAFTVNERVSYGYGVMHRRVGGCAVLQHSGGSNGYVSDFARIPERKAAVIILSNYGFADGAVNALRVKLVDRVTATNPCTAAAPT